MRSRWILGRSPKPHGEAHEFSFSSKIKRLASPRCSCGEERKSAHSLSLGRAGKLVSLPSFQFLHEDRNSGQKLYVPGSSCCFAVLKFWGKLSWFWFRVVFESWWLAFVGLSSSGTRYGFPSVFGYSLSTCHYRLYHALTLRFTFVVISEWYAQFHSSSLRLSDSA